ncbi:hypothetical protein Vafri_17712 [Volvox africanus]|nr:hypothetical protein Vafri_17712 [Volvox africanus]
MESTCPPGSIHVSGATREFLLNEDWEPTGGVMVKGKGVMETFRWVPLDPESSPQTRVTGGQRHNRPRRASSIAYIQTGGVGAGIGVTGGAGVGAPSREGSGNITLSLQAVQGVGSGPGGLSSATGSIGINSGANNTHHPSPQSFLALQNGIPVKGCRAASANITFTSAMGFGPPGQEGNHGPPGVDTSVAGQGPQMHFGRGRATGFTGSSLGSSNVTGMRRKPHRSCSTTALAYKGLSRPT